MVNKDIDICHPPKKNERVLFHKCIFNTEKDARNALVERKLAPGEIAVARYYVNYREEYMGYPSFDGIRMIMAIGGATPHNGSDTYFFKDSIEVNGDSYITIDQLKEILDGYYYTKEEVDKLLENVKNFDASNFVSKEEFEQINNKVNALDSSFVELSNNVYSKKEVEDLIKDAIDEIDIPKIDASNYYNKVEVDGFISQVNEEINNVAKDVSSLASTINKELEDRYTKYEVNKLIEGLEIEKLATKEEVNNYKSEITNIVNNKADASIVENISNELSNKVDASYVENYFKSNVESTVNTIIENVNIPNIVEQEIEKQNISQKVSDEVDKKLENFEGVTTETLDEALQNNEYFTTNVINPIENVAERVQTIETQIKDLDADIDGGEEEIWYINFANDSNSFYNSINNNENVEIESDIHFDECVILEKSANVAINVGNYSMTKNGNGAVIRVNGGKLVIDGEDGHINGDNNGSQLGDNQAVRCSNNGNVRINGGYFTVGDDGQNGGNSVIYCTEGLIEIYGGVFEYTGENLEMGNKFVLNCQNSNYNSGKANIVVYGGKFMNGYNPAMSYSDENGINATNFVAAGYKSVYNESDNSYIVIPN